MTAVCAQRTGGADDCGRNGPRPWTPQLRSEADLRGSPASAESAASGHSKSPDPPPPMRSAGKRQVVTWASAAKLEALTDSHAGHSTRPAPQRVRPLPGGILPLRRDLQGRIPRRAPGICYVHSTSTPVVRCAQIAVIPGRRREGVRSTMRRFAMNADGRVPAASSGPRRGAKRPPRGGLSNVEMC
jgi:hypothetical protein